MDLILDEERVKKIAYGIFMDRVLEDDCMNLWRNNLMSDYELIHRLTFLNMGCTHEAQEAVATVMDFPGIVVGEDDLVVQL